MLENLTKEQKENMKASLGVFIMTIMIAFWVPLTYLLLGSKIELIYISFAMVAYSAAIAYMSKFVVIVLGTPKDLIPKITPLLNPTKDTEVIIDIPEEEAVEETIEEIE